MINLAIACKPREDPPARIINVRTVVEAKEGGLSVAVEGGAEEEELTKTVKGRGMA